MQEQQQLFSMKPHVKLPVQRNIEVEQDKRHKTERDDWLLGEQVIDEDEKDLEQSSKSSDLILIRQKDSEAEEEERN